MIFFLKINSGFRLFLCSFYVLFITILALPAQPLSPAKASEQSNVLKAGAATIKITPPIGSIMGMSYGLTVSEGVYDDLYAEALILEEGDVKAAFITFDFISLPYIFVERTRELIAQRIGLPGKNIIMIAKHSHAGPQMNPLFWDAVDVVRAWKILDLAALKGGVQPRLTTTVPLTKDGGALKSEVQVLTLGDELALVGFPGDAFVELGLNIKLNSPFPFTIVNEQSANGTLSYVPNRKAFPEGAYEVISARFAPGGRFWLIRPFAS